MLTSDEIKSLAVGFGADRCGIAPVERFDGAPAGFNPRDVYNLCKTVIVILKQMPPEAIRTGNPVVYTHSASMLYSYLDKVGLELAYSLQSRGIRAVPVPTDVPYLYWDPEKMHGMGLISMRHAARNAGLGFLGRNTLLINSELGNLVYIGALLIDAVVDPDPVVTDLECPMGCSLCLEACPVKALDGVTVDQKLCRGFSTLEHPRGWDLYTCSACRLVCPLGCGSVLPC